MIGNSGNWDFETYWSVEHPTAPKPVVNGVTASNTYLPSRYTIYLDEITQGAGPGRLTICRLAQPRRRGQRKGRLGVTETRRPRTSTVELLWPQSLIAKLLLTAACWTAE